MQMSSVIAGNTRAHDATAALDAKSEPTAQPRETNTAETTKTATAVSRAEAMPRHSVLCLVHTDPNEVFSRLTAL